MNILITGFDSFLDNKINPSKEVLRSISFEHTRILILPVSYCRAQKQLLQSIKQCNPDLILSFGLASTRKNITIETEAFNLMDAKCVDEDKILKTNEKIIENNTLSLKTLFPVQKLLDFLKNEGFAANLSSNPGRYVCNEIYFTALMQKPLSLFIHLPSFDACSLETDIKFVNAVLEFINDEFYNI